tara:strand:- start:259 stop:1011 length:753 start_codon:yes stop_codon:yes gene_type:complete
MRKKTKISIVMPNYNSSLFLEQTVKSIINQSFFNWELIIVDDNSNFQTKKILKKYSKIKKIKIFFLKRNRGDGYCRLYGVKKAHSNIIAFIDSDDIWKKNKLKLQYNFMKNYNLNFTYTQYNAFKENGFKKRILPPKKYNFENFTKNTSIATSSMMIRRKLFNKIKLSNSPNFEDYFLKCQILKKIDYAYCLQNNLLNYRIRSKSLSNNKLRNIIWIWIINRKFNKMSFFKSLISVLLISVNSINKYGLK